MTTKYERCKKKVINDILKSYEKKKTVSRQQSLAIALQISEKKCKKKININDINKMENNINKMIEKNKLQLTNFNNALYLINYYKLNKKYSKVKNLENKILKYLLLNFINSKNNNNEKLNKISKLFLNKL